MVVVLRGTANLPTIPWIWDDTSCYVTTISAISHACLFRHVICIFYWSKVGAQEPIDLIFHAKISLLFCKLPHTHTSHNLHHLLTGLQQQMYPCVRKLVLVVSCECEWTILRFAGVIDYEIWSTTLCYKWWSVPNQYYCNFLARLYCLPCSQWPLLER